MSHTVHVERVYDEVRRREGSRGSGPPGPRFLVDRVWPRGVRKDTLEGVEWVREAAPSSELRAWFGHDPRRFEEFAQRYRAELDTRPEGLEPLLAAGREGPFTLLYAAKDTEHNHAVVLCAYLEEALAGGNGGN